MTKQCTFIRLESFARTGPHKKNSRRRKASVAGVFGEMVRTPGFCPHIAEPKPPAIVFGDPAVVLKSVLDQADRAIERTGKRLRSTALIAVCGVVSFPTPRVIVEADPKERERCERWWRQTRRWLEDHFGDALKLIVIHRDETYIHAHFAVVPNLGTDRRIDIGQVHPGEKAQRAARAAGEHPKLQKAAFKAAMSAFIDCYYEGVLMDFGVARIGPGKLRVDRRAWAAMKAQLEAIANRKEALIAEEQKIRQAAGASVAEQVAAATAAFGRQLETVKAKAIQRIQELEARNCSLVRDVEARDALVAELRTRLSALEAEIADYRAAYRLAG